MIGLEPQDADRCRVERKVLALAHGQADPTCGQHAAELAVRKEGDVAAESAKPSDHAVGAGCRVDGHVAARAAVFPDVPTGVLLANFGGAKAFVVAVVPFDEFSFDLGVGIQPGQFAGAAGAQPGAGQHLGKSDAFQARCQSASHLLAMRGQRQISAAGVLAGDRPGRFAVADEEELQKAVHGTSIAALY